MSDETTAENVNPCRWCRQKPEWGDLIIDVLICPCGIVFGIDRAGSTLEELVIEWNKRLGAID